MQIVNVCISAAVGSGCALAGVFAGPRVPERADMDRALAVTAGAVAAACAWGLCEGELAATMLTFVVVTYVAGELRARRALDRNRRPFDQNPQPSSSSPSPSRGSRR